MARVIGNGDKTDSLEVYFQLAEHQMRANNYNHALKYYTKSLGL